MVTLGPIHPLYIPLRIDLATYCFYSSFSSKFDFQNLQKSKPWVSCLRLTLQPVTEEDPHALARDIQIDGLSRLLTDS